MPVDAKFSPDFVLRQRRQAGAGMIEVMIAIVIAGFALLGLAGLQISAMRYQKVANYHAMASQHAAELADRVRANLEGVRLGAYNPPVESYSGNAPAAPSIGVCGTPGGLCTPQQAAQLDIFRWRENLNRSMLGGWGEISGTNANGFTIRVYYRESGVDGTAHNTADRNCRSGATTDPNVRCFVTVLFP